MVQDNQKPTSSVKEAISQDAAIAKKNLAQRFREALTKPVTFMIAGLVFLFTIGAEYVFSRTMDALWEVEPPEEIVKLNTELQSSSGQLKETSRELEKLLSKIDTSRIEDPKLRAQLEQLDGKLLSLNELVKKTSEKTDKVATISESLQQDWSRVKSKSDGWIDGVPDLVLGIGEGVQLCDGLSTIGITQIQQGRVWLSLASKKKNLSSGSRMQLNDQAYVDFIGTKNNKALFKVHCENG